MYRAIFPLALILLAVIHGATVVIWLRRKRRIQNRHRAALPGVDNTNFMFGNASAEAWVSARATADSFRCKLRRVLHAILYLTHALGCAAVAVISAIGAAMPDTDAPVRAICAGITLIFGALAWYLGSAALDR